MLCFTVNIEFTLGNCDEEAILSSSAKAKLRILSDIFKKFSSTRYEMTGDKFTIKTNSSQKSDLNLF